MADPAEIARGLRPSRFAFERPYSDESGTEYGVALDSDGEIYIESGCGTISFPTEELDWFIAALMAVRAQLKGETQ